MIQTRGYDKLKFANTDNTLLPFTFSEDNLFLPEGITSNPRQQRKIIGCFHNPEMIRQPDAIVSNMDTRSFMRDIARKEITDKKNLESKFKNLISKISGNLVKIKLFPMFGKIKDDRRLSGILAYFTQGSLYRREDINANDILLFLKKFPDPYVFQYNAKDFLDIIELYNSMEKRSEYEVSMKVFMELVYGKKFEYLMQINLLRRKARLIYLKNLENCREELDTLILEPVNKEEAEKVLKLTEVHGSPFKNQLLTPEILNKCGLLPTFKMNIKGMERAFFSPVFNIGYGRIAVVAYLKKGKKYFVASYYLSNSHAIWRYLDGYFMVENKIISYGKKGRQDSMNLSLVFQKALSIINGNNTPILDIQTWSSDFIFTGTTYNALFHFNDVDLNSDEKQENDSQKLSGNFYPQPGKRIPPEAMKFYNLNQAPDFSKLITHWRAENKIYGEIAYEAFLSLNGQFIYIFCRDEIGRIWLASIENHSKIQPTGVREIWVDGGNLTTPAYEYDIKAGIYGNTDLRWGTYIDMSKYYLGKIWKPFH